MRRLAFLTLLLVVGVAAAPSDTEAPVHFALSKSAPEADAAVESPKEIRLWFTQVPQENTMTIRLLDDGGDLLETGDVVQDEEDGKIYSVAVESALAGGAYTVAWRAIGQDGHVVRGDFTFSVTAQ